MAAFQSANWRYRPKSDIHCHSYQPAASRCKATIGDSSEQSIQFFNWHGLAEQIASKIHTPVFLQEVQLLLGLNPFRDNMNSERSTHGDNGTHDGCIVGVTGYIANERLIDLHFVQWKALQIRERGKASAEIV